MKQHITKLLLLVAVVCLGYNGANAQLSGTYTIGSGTGYDYASVAAAASAVTTNGVSGAVTFEIADGTYSGQVSFGAITGASSSNTITFISDSEDSSKVIITHNGSYTVYSTGADYVSFKDVTISNTRTSTYYNVYLASSSNYWSFENSRLLANRSGVFGYNIYWRGNEFLDVINTRIVGGYYQMYNWGNGTGSSASEGLHIENSELIGSGYYALYNRNLREVIIKNNRIDSMQRAGIGLYSYYCNMEWIESNEIIGANYGFYWFYGNTVGPTTDSTVVINNISKNNAIYGFYARDLDKVSMYHNVFEAPSSRYAFYWYNLRRNDISFANNIVIGGGFYGFYAYLGGTSYMPKFWDYNDYYLNNYTYFCYFNGYLSASLGALQTANRNYNQNCVSVDPNFLSSTNGRTYTPALNNIGIDMGVDTDIDGNTRPNTGDQGKVDIGANDFYLSPKDLDVYELVSPLSVSLGSNSITAQFRNAGSDTLKNEDVYVQYSTDSGATWVTDTMSIGTLAPGAIQQFTFDQTWTPTRSGYFRISIKISQSVNNDPDATEQEDYDVCSGLTGTFTIGGANADYNSFGDALKDLNCGVAGPIEYTVNAGVYNENLEFGELLGASATNTVTFKGVNRDSVTIRSTSGNTITLSGTDHLSFEDMTIRMDGSSGFTVSLTGYADYNRFENCVIYNNTSTISTACNPIVISGSSTSYSSRGASGNYNQFINNSIEGGYFGAYVTGASTSDYAVGNTWINNEFSDAYYYGFYSYYEDSLVFADNRIQDFRNRFNYSAMFYYTSNFNIERNYLKSAYGSYLAYANYYNYNSSAQSLFANNVLIGGSSWALYGYYMRYTNFWHNSIYGAGTRLVYWYYASNNDIQNNIFSYDGTGTALWFFNSSWINWDYNNYHLQSGNLAYISGTYYASLSALNAFSSTYNQNSISVDPKWVDEEDDHHLTSSSPDLFGTQVGMNLDHDQDNRCVFAPTIGPDEKTRVSLPPTANFLTPDTAWLGSPTVLLNSNTASKTSAAQWWVNGKMVSDSIHLEYTPINSGLDTITLVMENCSGTDTLTKFLFVSPILRAPSVDFSATSRDIYTGDIITMLDLSGNGATQWEWSISPKVVYDPFLLIWTRTHWYKNNDSTVANPQLYFDYPGVYQVKLKVANSFGGDSLVRTAYIKVRQRATMCD
ncbi:MAG: right-handed parallel beta-helix repeat-containing protein, partial [Bacteroidia bacterium]